MAGYDGGDRRVEPVEDRQDVAGQAVAALFGIDLGELAALMNEEDDGIRAGRLELGHKRVCGRCLVRKVKAGNSGRSDDQSRLLEGFADEADLDRADLADRGRGEQGAAVVAEDIAGEIFEAGAGERLQPAGFAAGVLAAAAGLHAQKLGRALVEFMVADRREAEAEHVHGVDGRLVEKVSRSERRGADQVAGSDSDRVGMAGPRTLQRRCKLRRAAHAGGDDAAIRLRDLHRVRGRFDIAVEVVDGEDLDLDRHARAERGGSRRAAGQRRQCKQRSNPAEHQRPISRNGWAIGSGWAKMSFR